MTPGAPLELEEEGWSRGMTRVVGVDEAGRGPLAGPVVAAAVALEPARPVADAHDSKRLAPGKRRELAGAVRRGALAWALGAASVREVERLDPRRASALAMRRALDRLPFEPELLLVDGRGMPELGPQRAVVGGDGRSRTIACASILAKVTRDRLMGRLHPRYPVYGWETNRGYGTAAHLEALHRFGPTPHHRRTFAPVAQLLLRM